MKKKSKIPIFTISKKQAKEISAQAKNEMDTFWKKHCADIKDPLTLILKCHLFIENCLDELLSLCLPKPKKILENSSFSYKVTLFESLNLSPNRNLVKKIKTINKLRNYYVHYLDKDLSQKEINQIRQGLGIKSKTLSFHEIFSAAHYVIGYLHALKTIEKLFPFIRNCQRNNDLIKKDDSFLYCGLMIKGVWPEFKKVLEYLKI